MSFHNSNQNGLMLEEKINRILDHSFYSFGLVIAKISKLKQLWSHIHGKVCLTSNL